MKQIEVACDMPFLPEEIIRDILIRLPVKTLIRSRVVCKHWENLIKTPSFISDHLHHSHTHQNPSLLLQRRYDLWLFDGKMKPHKVKVKANIAPVIGSPNTVRIVGSTNGLLCLSVYRYPEFYPSLLLWNPATREVRQLPLNTPNTKYADLLFQLPPYRRDVDLPFSIGFGFSPVVNDYKVVITYHATHYDYGFPCEVLLVVVYSLSSGSWKKVDFGIKNVDLGLGNESVTVNGIMFWSGFVRKPDTNTCYFTTVSFDMANEVFTLIPTPTPDWSTSTSRLTIYENKLAILSFSATQDYESSLIELWVMEDGSGASWAKKYSSCLIPWVARPKMTIWMNQIVCDGGENEYYRARNITLLNISTNELKEFNINKCGKGTRRGSIYYHAESLVPIGGKKL